ncbi:MAG: hypothetical protein CMQ11_07040 [Gammaproteobacteria bacterium]|nr:hypothetical protein [Gammaproteobacteria bacterium]
MGKGGKAQTVGYKYYLGMHLGMCHGPIDAFTRLQVDERDAWVGYKTSGSISITANTLFGGDKREGGVSGTIDLAMGEPTQGQNSYLVSKLGALIPAFRGVACLIFRQCYLGNNPYLKTWSARGQRVFKRQNGLMQWYPAKAAIASSATTKATEVTLSWWQSSSPQGGASLDTAKMTMRFWDIHGNSLGFHDSSEETGPVYPEWEQRSITATAPAGTARVQLFQHMWRNSGESNDGYIDDITLTFDGEPVVVPNPGAEEGVQGWTSVEGGIEAYEGGRSGGFRFAGGHGHDYTAAYQDIPLGVVDMNAAHIIRECLTDPEWGMGYTDDDVDDVSFRAAADIFFNEKLGLSLLWDKTKTIEDFVSMVQEHVDCALYVSRTTGKFVIKPIRGGYDEATLLHLDESNIGSVDDPTRITFGELTNSVTVTYWDATTGKDATVTIDDPALLRQQGVPINAPLQYPGFSNTRNATIAAQRDLKVLSSPLLSCTITANSDAKELEVGDVFKFSWSRWGLAEVVMRVNGISYGTGRNNRVKISCTQDVFDTDTNLTIVVPDSGWTDPSGPPSVVEQQLVAEAPYYELVQALGQSDTDNKLLTHPEIGYLIAAGLRPASAINAALYTDDGAGYEDVGAMDFCPSGVLSTNITKTQPNFVLNDGSDLEEVTIGTHFQIGEELMRVDAIDVETGAIMVGRGVLDTVPEEHLAGEVAFFWDAYAGFDPTEYVQGEEVDAKIIPISGAGVLPLDAADAMTLTLNQRACRPYAPGDLRINGESYAPNAYYEGEVTVTWTHRNRIEQTGGYLVDHTAGDIGPEPGVEYRLRLYVDDVLEQEIEPAVSPQAVTPIGSGVIRIEVHAKRDGVYSWQAPSHIFINSQAEARYTEEGEARVIEQGDVRVLEE